MGVWRPRTDCNVVMMMTFMISHDCDYGDRDDGVLQTPFKNTYGRFISYHRGYHKSTATSQRQIFA